MQQRQSLRASPSRQPKRRGQSPRSEPRGHATWPREHHRDLHAASRRANPPEVLASTEHAPDIRAHCISEEIMLLPGVARRRQFICSGFVHRATIASGEVYRWLLSARLLDGSCLWMPAGQRVLRSDSASREVIDVLRPITQLLAEATRSEARLEGLNRRTLTSVRTAYRGWLGASAAASGRCGCARPSRSGTHPRIRRVARFRLSSRDRTARLKHAHRESDASVDQHRPEGFATLRQRSMQTSLGYVQRYCDVGRLQGCIGAALPDVIANVVTHRALGRR